jgi:host factor-I protein
MMSKHQINIQDGFLFQNLKEANVLQVDLITGQRLTGRLRRFDRFAIVLEIQEGQELLVYKHAIATISQVSGHAPA